LGLSVFSFFGGFLGSRLFRFFDFSIFRFSDFFESDLAKNSHSPFVSPKNVKIENPPAKKIKKIEKSKNQKVENNPEEF
jgi:hypothetical protein